jgi:hypothetical protein
MRVASLMVSTLSASTSSFSSRQARIYGRAARRYECQFARRQTSLTPLCTCLHDPIKKHPRDGGKRRILYSWSLKIVSGAAGLFLQFRFFSGKPIQHPSYGHKHCALALLRHIGRLDSHVRQIVAIVIAVGTFLFFIQHGRSPITHLIAIWDIYAFVVVLMAWVTICTANPRTIQREPDCRIQAGPSFSPSSSSPHA